MEASSAAAKKSCIQPTVWYPFAQDEAPKAVQPVHVPGFVVQCHVIVQRGIHASGAQPQRNRQKTEENNMPGGRKAQQRQGGHQNAEHRDAGHPKTVDGMNAEQAGNDRPAGHDHGNNAREMDGGSQVHVHGRPGRSQKRIGQAKADKGQIDDDQEQAFFHQPSEIAVER